MDLRADCGPRQAEAEAGVSFGQLGRLSTIESAAEPAAEAAGAWGFGAFAASATGYVSAGFGAIVESVYSEREATDAARSAESSPFPRFRTRITTC